MPYRKAIYQTLVENRGTVEGILKATVADDTIPLEELPLALQANFIGLVSDLLTSINPPVPLEKITDAMLLATVDDTVDQAV